MKIIKKIATFSFFSVLCIIQSPLAVASTTPDAPGRSTWTVLGFREPNSPAVGDIVTEFRRALQVQLNGRGNVRVRTESETRAALGLASIDTSALMEKVRDAEGTYQQYALDAARRKFETVLQDLPYAGGEEGIWEATKSAHLLLGMVHLADQSSNGTARARAELEAILRIDPRFKAVEAPDDQLMRTLLEKTRSKVNRDPAGTLRVTCTPACPEGFVWVDSAPGERVDRSSIRLPAGTYRVRVTDRFDSPRLRSLTHDVTINPNAETVLDVDLEGEGMLESTGPSFVSFYVRQARNRAMQVATKAIPTGSLFFLWTENSGASRRLNMAVVDAAFSRVERRAFVVLPSDGRYVHACEELARYAATGNPSNEVAVVDAVLAPPQVSSEITSRSGVSPLRYGAFAMTGGAVALGVAGVVVLATKDSDSKSNVDTGLLIGAGACAVTAIALFIIDSATSPSVADVPKNAPDAPNMPQRPNLPSAPGQLKPPAAPKLPMGFAINF